MTLISTAPETPKLFQLKDSSDVGGKNLGLGPINLPNNGAELIGFFDWLFTPEAPIGQSHYTRPTEHAEAVTFLDTGWLVKAYIKGFPDSCQFTRGGLAFLIKNLYYEDIAVNISNTLDLESQGIKVYLSQNKTINIYNITKTKTSSIKKNSGTSKRLIGYLSKTPLLKQLQFQYQELAYALENTDLNKTPGPDGIHGRMISNLGKIGRERLLNIFNNSWKTEKLLQDCKNATIIPI
ncbi:hypothetical protein LAZ67_21000036 [Cordylochernes scorpioides]|uniref:Uncharacterized protein n=1 Tax=Cordylochernes scorpioides TaxID=51811 RepID=A0ABY6LNH3_9ARAC|nr:hypothetical protein LAZ67_21000036 [Cordylochernes scorpioides]